MKRSKKIFFIVAALFLATIIGFTIHFMSLTHSPWTKNKIQKKYIDPARGK
ncbi:MAG: hypothetical protein GY827_02125 [Cytophagales bacterium]|nr:hypothetical protein [Cytophagales bacterium]